MSRTKSLTCTNGEVAMNGIEVASSTVSKAGLIQARKPLQVRGDIRRRMAPHEGTCRVRPHTTMKLSRDNENSVGNSAGSVVKRDSASLRRPFSADRKVDKRRGS